MDCGIYVSNEFVLDKDESVQVCLYYVFFLVIANKGFAGLRC